MSKVYGSKVSPELKKEIDRILSTSDYYEVLGCKKGCMKRAFLRGYRKQCMRFTPEVCEEGSQAALAFNKVSCAYECLTDFKRRQEYDKTGIDPEVKVNIIKKVIKVIEYVDVYVDEDGNEIRTEKVGEEVLEEGEEGEEEGEFEDEVVVKTSKKKIDM